MLIKVGSALLCQPRQRRASASARKGWRLVSEVDTRFSSRKVTQELEPGARPSLHGPIVVTDRQELYRVYPKEVQLHGLPRARDPCAFQCPEWCPEIDE